MPYAGRVLILPRIRFPSHVKLEATNFLKTLYSRKLLQSLKIVNLKSPQYTDRTRTVMCKCKQCVSLTCHRNETKTTKTKTKTKTKTTKTKKQQKKQKSKKTNKKTQKNRTALIIRTWQTSR